MKGICVGMGVRGKAWYQWAQQAGIEVAGVVDMNRQILDRAGDELEIPGPMRYTSIGAAAAATAAEVATVCCANPAHAQCIEECLDAGLHLIVEKPMVETASDARRLMAMAKQKNLRIAVSQNYRLHPAVQAIQKAVQAGRIGDVVSVHIDFARWRPAPGMFLPLMLNQGIHHFDAIRFILGTDPQWCFARSWNPSWSPSESPTLLAAIWGFNGSDGEIIFTYNGTYVTYGAQMPYSGCWRVEGTAARLEIANDADTSHVVLTRREGDQLSERLPSVKCDLPEPAEICRQFLDALRRGHPASTDATDNIKSLAMAWVAQKSSDEKRVVRIDEVLG